MLINLCDSSFAIGESSKDAGLRYLKQIKASYLCSIRKNKSFLEFEFLGYGTERDHLKPPTDKDRDVLIEKVKEMSTGGKSLREIAVELGISKATAGRYLNKSD